ncbi:MAG: hypothetical protein K8R56_09440 [Candidatus Eisenbacteria bacterium]|nr:hypothetical protein [Candidatus Eisenbacteria bacterium]
MDAMLRRSVSVLLLLFAIALPGMTRAAGSTAPGYYLRWEQCYTDGGASNRSFACDTNTGTSTLVLSFELDQPMPDVSGLEILIDFATPEATLPAWWQFKNIGSCRQASLTFLPQSPAGATNCVDWASGQAVGGFGTFVPVTTGVAPGRVRLGIAIAVLPTALATLTAGQEYVACLLQIDHRKTVGTNACTGCDLPACIHFGRLKLTTPIAQNDRSLSAAADGPGSGRVTWQDGAFANVERICGQIGCTTDFTCTSVTPAHGHTWSDVKALYR